MDVCPRPWQSSGVSLNDVGREHNQDSNTRSHEQTKESIPSPWNNAQQVQARISVQLGHGTSGEGPPQQGSKKVEDLALVYEQVKGVF